MGKLNDMSGIGPKLSQDAGDVEQKETHTGKSKVSDEERKKSKPMSMLGEKKKEIGDIDSKQKSDAEKNDFTKEEENTATGEKEGGLAINSRSDVSKEPLHVKKYVESVDKTIDEVGAPIKKSDANNSVDGVKYADTSGLVEKHEVLSRSDTKKTETSTGTENAGDEEGKKNKPTSMLEEKKMETGDDDDDDAEKNSIDVSDEEKNTAAGEKTKKTFTNSRSDVSKEPIHIKTYAESVNKGVNIDEVEASIKKSDTSNSLGGKNDAVSRGLLGNHEALSRIELKEKETHTVTEKASDKEGSMLGE